MNEIAKNDGSSLIERLWKKGAKALTDKELVMIILGWGDSRLSRESASRLLKAIDRDEELSRRWASEVPGVTETKAAGITAALELARRRTNKKERRVTTASEAYRLLSHYAAREQEHFVVMMLSGAQEVLGTVVSTIGTLNRTLVHPREVFAPAIERRAASVIVAHNHPSGILLPSAEDRAITDRISTCGDMLGIKVLDHLVLTTEGYWSFKEHSLI